MALAARGAVPACLLVLLAFLPSWDTQIRPQGEPGPGVNSSINSKNSLKEIIKLLGSSVKVKATPSSLTTQEIPFSNSYTVLIGYKLHKISPNILVDTPVRPNKVKGAGTEEEITLLPGLKQDKDAGRRTALIVPDHGKTTADGSKRNHPFTVKQETPSTNKKLQSSVMEDILQELQEHLVRRPSTSDGEEPMLMDNMYSSNELEDPEEAGYSEENHNKLTEPLPEETDFLPFPDEPPLIHPLEASSVPNLVTEVTHEHMNDAQRYEFFEKYEGIQGKKKSKAADLKDLLKHIIIACVAVTGLILTVIVVVHIYTSLFVKKEQEPDKTNADKNGGPDKNDVTSAEKTRSQQPHYNVGIEGAQNQQLEYAVNIVETGNQQLEDSTVGIDNQNNNNLSSPPEMFSSTDCDYIKKPLDLHPVKALLSPSSQPEDTGLLLPVEPSRHTAHNSLPSYNSSTCKHLKVQPRTFRTKHSSYNWPGNYGKSQDHDYKRLQAKDTACYKTKPICQRPSKHRPKSTEPKRGHKRVSAKQHSHSSSSWVGDPSSNVSAALDTNKNSKESRLSQDDDSDCACFQHFKGSSSTDSYSN
ncbi:uncharacterized protein LOC117046040 isoform X2 [Lacerta agilis]|uniref:uncharacterized protein LOC117046040 isoform X2 n=1 Tax=Lacerta agilis TaxID=80427 RepID=UPI0014196729|nr:uncharacterized protein LOC117046040 isoform X2 [Lacerta agilis]